MIGGAGIQWLPLWPRIRASFWNWLYMLAMGRYCAILNKCTVEYEE